MAYVSDIGFRRVAVGQTITIFGGGLDVGCSVKIGDETSTIVDFYEDRIEALAPLNAGDYDVKVICNGVQIDAGSIHVSELADSPTRSFAKDYDIDDFNEYVNSLMPRGNAFSVSKGSYVSKLKTAIANSLLFVWNTIKDMMTAIDPTHTENYNEWEKELNLPVVGINPQTFNERLAEIYRTECCNGGCSKGFIKKILFLMGIDADVYEYTKEPEQFANNTFPSGADKRFYAKIVFHLHPEDFNQFRAGVSSAGDYLLDFTQYMEESVFEKIKPAHVKFIYGYDDGARKGYYLDSAGNRIIASDNKPLTYEEHLW